MTIGNRLAAAPFEFYTLAHVTRSRGRQVNRSLAGRAKKERCDERVEVRGTIGSGRQGGDGAASGSHESRRAGVQVPGRHGERAGEQSGGERHLRHRQAGHAGEIAPLETFQDVPVFRREFLENDQRYLEGARMCLDA